MTKQEKINYLETKVYENIKENQNGVLSISTYYARKVAEMLDGDYDSLSISGKRIFKHDITQQIININKSFSKYCKL